MLESTLRNRFWLKLFDIARRQLVDHSMLAGNRRISKFSTPSTEITVTYRDKTQEDGYERTEILEMLQTVRSEEKRQEWKCPEPTC